MTSRATNDVEDESALRLADARTVRRTGGPQPAPPEDSGRVCGYGALLVAIKNPHHPDFDLAHEVLGDAGEFDAAAVDSRLRGVPVS